MPVDILTLSILIVLPAVLKTIYHYTGDVHLLSSDEEWKNEL